MIPSNKWFPTSFESQALWYANFNAKAASIGSTVGLVAADLVQINNDNEVLTFLMESAATIETYMDSVRQFRKIITQGDIGDPIPTFPADMSFTPPTAVPTGIFERLDKYVKRIKASAAYTDEVGAEFGIIPSKGDDIVETEMKPMLKAAAMPGSVVEVTFTRGKSDGIVIELQTDNSMTWTPAGTFFKSPAPINVPDGTGLPHSVRIRGRYVIGNEPVGLNSDTVNVVTTP